MKTKKPLALRRVQRPDNETQAALRKLLAGGSAQKKAEGGLTMKMLREAQRVLDANSIPTVGRYVYSKGKLYGPSA